MSKVKKRISKISENSYVSIALMVTLVGAVMLGGYKFGKLEQRQHDHINDLALHHNIGSKVDEAVKEIHEKFVTKESLDSRLEPIETDVAEIKKDVKDVKGFLIKID